MLLFFWFLFTYLTFYAFYVCKIFLLKKNKSIFELDTSQYTLLRSYKVTGKKILKCYLGTFRIIYKVLNHLIPLFSFYIPTPKNIRSCLMFLEGCRKRLEVLNGLNMCENMIELSHFILTEKEVVTLQMLRGIVISHENNLYFCKNLFSWYCFVDLFL